MRTFRARTPLIVSLLASSVAWLGACTKQPEPQAQQDKPEVAQVVEVGDPVANPKAEATVVEGQGAPPKEPAKPVEPVAELDEDEDEQPEVEIEVPPYPEQVGQDPAAFVHPPAEAVIVVASTRSYSPGETGVDRDAKFHTWIWRPALGDLPTKDAKDAKDAKDPAAAPASPALEEFDGLLVSDGSALTQLSLEETVVELPKCECQPDTNDWRPTGKVLAKTLFELRAQPYVAGSGTEAGAGPAKVLIGATDFERKSGMDCITEREDVEHVLQIASVAGARVFVVERVRDHAVCTESGAILELRTQKLIDLAGSGTELAALERELAYKVVRRARTKASEALAADSDASAAALAPVNLLLTAVFPKYREHRGGVRLLLQYAAETGDIEDSGLGGWGNGYDANTITIAYPESSSLTAPGKAMELIEYVHGQAPSKWKVLGWSQINASAAPSPE